MQIALPDACEVIKIYYVYCPFEYLCFAVHKTSNILRQSTFISIASGTVNTTVSTTTSTTSTTTTTSLLQQVQQLLYWITIRLLCYICLYMHIIRVVQLQYILNTHGYEQRTILVPVMNTAYTKNRL